MFFETFSLYKEKEPGVGWGSTDPLFFYP